jgi:hypothetical protein
MEQDPEARSACDQCGEWNWDTEEDLNVGQNATYEILNEIAGRGNVTTLDLRYVDLQVNHKATLSYRLWTDYRHRRGNLVGTDGRGLWISFWVDPATKRWEIRDLRHADPPSAPSNPFVRAAFPQLPEDTRRP